MSASGVPEERCALDLATVEALVRWVDQARARAGAEYAEALLDLSEAAGWLSRQMRDVLLALARLHDDDSLDGEPSVAGITPGETAWHLVQLDLLLGNAVSR